MVLVNATNAANDGWRCYKSYTMSNPIVAFHSQTFTTQMHTTFTVRLADGTAVPLELVEVRTPVNQPGIEFFALLFRGPNAPRLPQQIHHLEHAALGKFDLFITAVAGDAESISYEAIFHRLLKKS